MTSPEPTLARALARLESRWGSAAVRLGNGAPIGAGNGADMGAHLRVSPRVEGALAPILEPFLDPPPEPVHPLAPLRDDVVSTGFPALDALLGTDGLPREVSAAIRGDASSGKLTLALRCMAEAQAGGAIVAFLDLCGVFDPLEAVARGVDLRWLMILRPADPAEGFALAGALLAGRSVDLLTVDLPARLPSRQEDSLRRLSAHARRVGARLLVLEPERSSARIHGALAEATSMRLELVRSAWIRLGRDVVGQQTRVTVAKNRFGPPGRRIELEIRYTDDGDRATATGHVPELTDRTVDPTWLSHPPRLIDPRTTHHATALPRLAPSPASPGTSPPRVGRKGRLVAG